MNNCPVCNVALKKAQNKYCSNLCQSREAYHRYIDSWKSGLVDGSRGISTRSLSEHIKHYFKEKFGETCCLCGWNKKNPVTGKVPLELDHINGDSEDNREENIRLVCPNCHSLSPNYRNLNKGHGRTWRINKYIKNTTTKLQLT